MKLWVRLERPVGDVPAGKPLLGEVPAAAVTAVDCVALQSTTSRASDTHFVNGSLIHKCEITDTHGNTVAMCTMLFGERCPP